MSEGIEDINVQLIEFGGENGVQALVKLDKTYRITISNEEIQNSMKDSVTSLTQEEMDELDNMPVIEDNSSPEQDTVLEEKSSPEQDADVNIDNNPDDNIVKDLSNRLEELHNNFEQESQTQLGGQSLEQVSIAVAIALLNNELDNKLNEGDNLGQINELKEPDNESILSNILEKGKDIVSSIQSIEDVKTEEIEKHLEDIKNEIKDKDFPKTQKSIEDVKESIDIINMKNDMSNV